MFGRFLISSMLLFGIASAGAQNAPMPPATEDVTVTGIKDMEAAVGKFVQTMTVPTRAADKVARWKDGVCPLILGVPPEIGKAMAENIRHVAAKAGAPVNTSDACANNVPGTNNVEVIFTTQPQALLDNVRIMHPNLLGYFDNSAQAEQLATMRAPIQSWYITSSVDMHGQTHVDAPRKGGVTLTMMLPPAGIGGPSVAPTMFTMNLPDATSAAATDSRLGDGISSTISNVVIVADTSKLLGRERSVLADYIALLALSQTQPPASCQQLPTILNLLAPDCSQAPRGLTAADMAYLQALYKITPTANVRGQRSEMTYQMNKALGAAK
jgi:hypothetical protein